MLIMREPLKPKSLSPVKCFLGDAMEKRITANYRQMEAQYSAEELFHIASQPPEIYLEEGGQNASLINQTNIRNQQEIKQELVCNLLNRLAVSGEGKYTYQDRVYIENMLRKLSVRDTQTFMRQVQNFREDTQNVHSLLQIYQQHFDSLKSAVGSVRPEQERSAARNKENGEYTQEIKRERYLHQSILERLGTDRFNTLLREVYRPVPVQEQKVSRQEIVLSEQSRLGAGMELQNVENRVLGRKIPAHFSRVNIYEEGAEATGEVTKQEILSELSEAVLLNLTDSLYQMRQESIRSGRDLYFTWNGGFEQIVENTMERFLAGHSEEPDGERSTETLTAYQERVNDVRRQEVAQLRQITAELRASDENSSQPEKMTEVERVYLESREGETEEDRLPESGEKNTPAEQRDFPASEEISDSMRERDNETVRIRSLTIDRARARRDSLRALENPEEVIREYLASTTELEELEARRDRSIRESMSEETRRMLSRVEELRPGTVPGFQNRNAAALPERPGEPAGAELSHREPVSVPETEEESAEQEAQRRENEILREELLREVLTAAERLTRTEASGAPQDTGTQNRAVSDAGRTPIQQGTEHPEAYRQLITLRTREEETRLSHAEELCRRMEELYVNWNQSEHTQTEETVRLRQEISRMETFAASSRQRLRELENSRETEQTEEKSFAAALPSELHIQEEYRTLLSETQQKLQRIDLTQNSEELRRELLETIGIWNEESEAEYREWQSLYHNIEDIEQSIQQIQSLTAEQQIPDAQRKAYIDSLRRTSEEVRTWREYWQENGVSLHRVQPLQILYRELERASEEVFGEAPYNSILEQNVQGNPHAELIRETAHLLEQLKMAVSPAAAEPFYSSETRGAAEEQIKLTEYDRQTSQIRSTAEEVLNQLEVSRLRQREDLIQRLTEISRSSEEFLEYARNEISGEDESDSAAQQLPRTESSVGNENVASIVHAATEFETIQNNIQREIETIRTGIQTAPRPDADVFAGSRDADGKLTVIHRQLAGEQSREAYTIPEEQYEILQREQTDYERYRTELTEMYSELQRVKSILSDTPENQERLQRISSQVEEMIEEFRHIAETTRQQKELYRTLQHTEAQISAAGQTVSDSRIHETAEILSRLEFSRRRQREDLTQRLTEISRSSEEFLEYARNEIPGEDESDSAAQQRTESSVGNENVTSIVHAATELETIQNNIQREIETIRTGMRTELPPDAGVSMGDPRFDGQLPVIHRQLAGVQSREAYRILEEEHELLRREQTDYERYRTELTEMYGELQRIKSILPDTPENQERLQTVSSQVKETIEVLRHITKNADAQISAAGQTISDSRIHETAEALSGLEVSRRRQREDLTQRLTEISRNSEEFLEYARNEISGEDESDSAAQQQPPRTEFPAGNQNAASSVYASTELETIQNNIQREIETIRTGMRTELPSDAGVSIGTPRFDGRLTVIHRQLAGEQSREAYAVLEEQHEMLRREQTDYERYRTELSEMYSELQRVKSILPDTPENQERLQSVSSQVKETLEGLRHIAETVRQQKEMYRTLQIENILSEQSRTVSTESRSRRQVHERTLRQYTELTELSKNMLAEETDETVTAVIQENLQKLEEIQKRFDSIASRSVHETEESFDRQERTLLQEQIKNRQEYQNTLQEMLIELQKRIAPSGADSQNAGRMSAASMNHRRLAEPAGEEGLRSALTSALSGGEISVSHPAAARGGRMSDHREKAEYRRTLLRNKLEQTLENVRRENRSWMELLQAAEYTERTDNLRELISRLHTWNTRMQNQAVSESVREPARILLRRIWEVSLPDGERTPAEVREALSEVTNIRTRADQPQSSLKPEVRQTILEYLETARTAETLEQEQIRTHEHRSREETEHLVQTVHRELLRQESSPRTESAPMAQPSERPNIELVHKQEQQGIDEAVLEEFRIRQRASEMALQERREEVTNRNVSIARKISIPIPNMPDREQAQISEAVSRSIQGQLNTISDQVYSRLEKRLTSDRKRRGY